MRFLFLPLGTVGDLVPFIEVGAALQARGHEVLLASAEPFREMVEERGLTFRSVLSAEQHRRCLDNPDLWHPRRFFQAVVDGFILPSLGPSLELIASQPEPTQLRLVAAYSGSPAARLGSELTGARHFSLWTDAAALRSLIHPPVYSGVEFMSRLPPWLRRPLRWGLDRWADLLLAAPINALRAGRPPVRNVLQWMVSAERSICLFPPWFARPQADWPRACSLAGFVLAPARPLPLELERFLDQGPPPLLATFGTGMRQPARLLNCALQAAERSGLRVLLVAPRQAEVPAWLPNGCALSQDHPSFTSLLPRVRVLVHHGGSGNCAQALAAGTPQLVVPMAHDQPDNAQRLVDLGVAASLPARRFDAEAASAALARLLEPSVARRCQQLSRLVVPEQSLQRACLWLES
ncbi:MAG: glycosyltransferase [Vulcanimicrobiota bacterium]